MSDFAMVLPFDTDEPEFTRGVEVGMIWERLQHDPDLPMVVPVVHASNAEMVLRIGERLELHASAVETADEWMEVTFSIRDGMEGT